MGFVQFTILAVSELKRVSSRVGGPSPENSSFDCVGGLECLISLIRALDMGSCLSSSSSSSAGGSKRSLHGSSNVPPRRKTSRRRSSSSCSSSFDNIGEEEPLLHRIPGRMFLNGSTDNASLFSQQGKKGPNQDAMIVWEVSL